MYDTLVIENILLNPYVRRSQEVGYLLYMTIEYTFSS